MEDVDDIPPGDIPPEAGRLLDESERVYKEEVAAIEGEMRPQYEAIMHLDGEEFVQKSYELYMLRGDLQAGPQSRWQMRNARIADRFQ